MFCFVLDKEGLKKRNGRFAKGLWWVYLLLAFALGYISFGAMADGEPIDLITCPSWPQTMGTNGRPYATEHTSLSAGAVGCLLLLAFSVLISSFLGGYSMDPKVLSVMTWNVTMLIFLPQCLLAIVGLALLYAPTISDADLMANRVDKLRSIDDFNVYEERACPLISGRSSCTCTASGLWYAVGVFGGLMFIVPVLFFIQSLWIMIFGPRLCASTERTPEEEAELNRQLQREHQQTAVLRREIEETKQAIAMLEAKKALQEGGAVRPAHDGQVEGARPALMVARPISANVAMHAGPIQEARPINSFNFAQPHAQPQPAPAQGFQFNFPQAQPAPGPAPYEAAQDLETGFGSTGEGEGEGGEVELPTYNEWRHREGEM